MMRRFAAGALTVILLAGCSSSKLTGAVSGYGTAVNVAVKAQQEQLTSFSTQETKRISDDLAARRAELTYSKGCVAVVNTPETVGDCYVVTRDGQRIATPYEASNIVALGAALEEYARQLNRLAADSSKDGEAFVTSMTTLAASIAELSGAVAKSTGTKPAVTEPQLGAVAKVVATVGNVYLQREREAALRRIIIASDPFVQQATTALSKADEVLRGYGLTIALDKLSASEEALAQAIADKASVGIVQDRQAAFLRQFDEFKKGAAMQSGFKGLGAAHARLADVARSGASAEDMLAYMRELMAAAKSIAQSVQTLRT
jgi:hypothetical protein